MRRIFARLPVFVCGTAIFFALSSEHPMWGSDPPQRLSQMAHRAWRIREGGFQGTPAHFAQTPDGYLWATGSAGLQRFNGVKFSAWKSPDGTAPEATPGSIVATSSGDLWIGTGAGVFHIDGERATNLDVDGPVTRIAQDSSGGIWISRMQRKPSGPICEVTSSRARCEPGFPFQSSQKLVVDQSNHIWLGNAQICRWDGNSCGNWFPETVDGNRRDHVAEVTASPDGSVWAAHDDGGRTELAHFSEGRWNSHPVPGFTLGPGIVSALFADREGSVWVGTSGEGIYRIHDGAIDHMDIRDGLSGNAINSFFTDREGTMWVATEGGVDNLQALSVPTWTTREGLSQQGAFSAMVETDGRILISHRSSVDVMDKGQVHPMPLAAELRGKGPYVFLRDRAGRLWTGGFRSIWVQEGGRVRSIPLTGTDRAVAVYDLLEDSEHTVWARTSTGVDYVREGQLVDAFPESKYPVIERMVLWGDKGCIVGLRSGGLARVWPGHFEMLKAPQDQSAVRGLDTAGGRIWAVTDKTLTVWANGEPRVVYRADGAVGDLNGLIADGQGDIWFWSEARVMVIRQAEIQSWVESPNRPIRFTTLDALDGVHAPYNPFGVGAVRFGGDKIWTVSLVALQELDPEHFVANSMPPPLKIEGVVADHKLYPANAPIRFPPSTHDLEIDYTALTFTTPEKVRFRYRLIGSDKDWQDAGDRRQAFYTNLKPGSYTFQVIACNSSGVWNSQGATVGMTIPPMLLESTWFRTLIAGCLLLLVWGGTFLRIRNIRMEAQARLNERLLERERIARALHDTLLQGVQALILRFHTIGRTLPADASTQDAIAGVLEEAEKVVGEGRDRVNDLRRTGWSSVALSTQLEQLEVEAGQLYRARLSISAQGTPRALVAIVQDEVYLICREAILNSWKHASANQIRCAIQFEEKWLIVRCGDDGKGLETAILQKGNKEGHFGLAGMRERAAKLGATLTWRCNMGEGTEVELRVPGQIAFRKGEKSPWDRFRPKQ
jgi:signal transduction histidine kinase/ligand-binding sensor domain-containing protein